MKDINDIVEKWVGRQVYVEGQFPLPTGQPGSVASSAVYSDGYAILEKGNKDATILFRSNLRSINLVPEQSNIVTPNQRIITG